MDQNVRDLFPAAWRSIYLNSAVIGPMPRATVEAVTSQLTDVATYGSANMNDWFVKRDSSRALIALMLNVRSEDIAFTRNTSDGLCAVASGMKWKEGDNIVSFANEFPANYYPWRKLQQERGVELRLCPERDGRIDIAELCGLIDGRTRLVTVSAVQYESGFRIDLEQIGRAARRADALFAVDIIQAFGAMPLNLQAGFVDVAAGASYKWLCAPQGCGLLYLNARARERVKPCSYSWFGVEKPWDFADRDQPCISDTRAWETGMGPFSLMYGLEKSLMLLSSLGLAKTAAYLIELTDFLCEILPLDRYRIVSSRAPGERSQIVSIEPKDGDVTAIAEKLKRENIVVSARGRRLRVAPHIFNNFADIERFAACLP